MKLQGKSVRVTTVSGELSEAELLAYVRQTLAIPDGVAVRFWVGDSPHDADITLGEPVRFSLTLEVDIPLDISPASVAPVTTPKA